MRRFLRWIWAPLTCVMVAVSLPGAEASGRLALLPGSGVRSEVPDAIVRAIAQVETGTRWLCYGTVTGTWRRGAAREVGPWQLTPAVLAQMGEHRPGYVHRRADLAEELTCRWLLHLYLITGSWPNAIAAYHVGLHGSRAAGLAYAERVLALAGL